MHNRFRIQSIFVQEFRIAERCLRFEVTRLPSNIEQMHPEYEPRLELAPF